MSALDKMLMGQLSKALPPEVAAHLTPEGMQNLGVKVGGMVDFFRNGVVTIVQQNTAILNNQAAIMVALKIESPTNANVGPNLTVVGGTGGGNGDGGDAGNGGGGGSGSAAA